MNRKHLIILSVVMNAGLLLVLCIGALSSKEKFSPKDFVATKVPETVAYDPTLVETQTPQVVPTVAPTPQAPIHKLPSVAQELAPSIEVAQEEKAAVQVTEETLATPKNEIKKEQFYVVQCGDNPWTIAIKHHIKVSELLKLNHLDNKKARQLKPGDRLRIR